VGRRPPLADGIHRLQKVKPVEVVEVHVLGVSRTSSCHSDEEPLSSPRRPLRRAVLWGEVCPEKARAGQPRESSVHELPTGVPGIFVDGSLHGEIHTISPRLSTMLTPDFAILQVPRNSGREMGSPHPQHRPRCLYLRRTLSAFHSLIEGFAVSNINQVSPALEGRQGREVSPALLGLEKETQGGLHQFRHSTSPPDCLPLQERHDGIING
jgi:hypothetical protein